MFSFALIRPRADEWRGWLPLALAVAMFVALLALGGDRGYFYRKGEFHEFDTIKTLAIAEHLSPEHDFRLAYSVWQDEDGGFRYKLYSRFPIGGYALTKAAVLPFGDDLAAKLMAARVLMLLMCGGAAALSYLAIARIAGSRWVALVAVALAFSSFYAVYYADAVFSQSAMDVFGIALAFHGAVVFAQEGRFRQLLVKVGVALLLGWRVYALLMPFIAFGLGGEALALWRAAVASNGKANVLPFARSALVSLARSRYVVLAVGSFLFGAALLAFNLATEYTAYGGERAPSELPTVRSMTERFGLEYASDTAFEWDDFLRLQLYRAGVASVPYAVARAVGYDVPTTDPANPPLAPALLGAAATCAALALTAFARRNRALMATAVLFGFCWAIPMRHTTFAPYHTYEALPYLWLALALFALALIAARRWMADARRVGFALAAIAAPIFAVSVFLAGQLDRDADEAALGKATLADFSAIMETVRGESVQVVTDPKLWLTEGEDWRWDFDMRYYLSGSYFAPPSDCARAGGADFAVSRIRDDKLDTLTPENAVMFLYETPPALELCRAERRRLESLEPMAREAFDVYLQDSEISYLKAPCAPSDYAAPFFAYAYPARASDLPAEHRRKGFHPTREPVTLTKFGAAFDGACIMTLRLPEYPVSAIRTGQRLPDGASVWDVFITPPPEAKTLRLYDEQYRAVASSGEPAARAEFDLYLDGGALFYLKEPCGADDARGRFFLSVYPADARDLPESMRGRGHESLNFDFSPPFGVVFDGKCMATRRLPDYDIARIETGQWIPGGGRLWDMEMAVGD